MLKTHSMQNLQGKSKRTTDLHHHDSVFVFSPQIENYLYRNHETRKYLQEQAYRLQQGIVTTTTQQVCKQTDTNTHSDFILFYFYQTSSIIADRIL